MGCCAFLVSKGLAEAFCRAAGRWRYVVLSVRFFDQHDELFHPPRRASVVFSRHRRACARQPHATTHPLRVCGQAVVGTVLKRSQVLIKINPRPLFAARFCPPPARWSVARPSRVSGWAGASVMWCGQEKRFSLARLLEHRYYRKTAT